MRDKRSKEEGRRRTWERGGLRRGKEEEERRGTRMEYKRQVRKEGEMEEKLGKGPSTRKGGGREEGDEGSP